MIKKLLTIACFTVMAASMNSQNFSLYYSFSSVTGTANPITVDPTPAPSATGVTSGSFTAVGTGTGSTTNGVFSFVGWDLGATNANNTTFNGSLNLSKYYEIVLTPQPNYAVSLTNMTFGATRSGTGVRHFAVRTNRDGYVANTAATYTPYSSAASASVQPISVQGGNTWFWNDDATVSPASFATYNICSANFSGPSFTNQATPYNIRMYAWDAEGSGGTFRIDTVRINGVATFSPGVGLPKLSHDINANFKLYPNPSNDGVAVLEVTSVSVSKVEMITVLGAVVASQNIALNEEKIKLDLATLPAGTYFVRVTSEKGISSEKLIITK
ncbi:MAG: hypothetical protein JWO32_2278 [Bacteroidetes bacterium]|nr:hypothetical protein [Bacteroidota bacterium]